VFIFPSLFKIFTFPIFDRAGVHPTFIGTLCLFGQFVKRTSEKTNITKPINSANHSGAKAATTVGNANIAVQE
jgi:hypothetical protein